MSEKSAKLYRTRIPRVYSKEGSCRFGELIPVLNRFVLPGDIWRINSGCLIRYQPMLAPPFNKATALFRFFFVPLRLVESDFVAVLTQAKDGHYSTSSMPTKLKQFLDYYSVVASTVDLEVKKYSIADYLSFALGHYYYKSGGTVSYDLRNCKTTPAAYWLKAYARIYWDWYRDENLFTSYDTPDTFINAYMAGWINSGSGSAFGSISDNGVFFANGNKDYFMSALPWQLKGVAPTISVGQQTVNFDFSDVFPGGIVTSAGTAPVEIGTSNDPSGSYRLTVGSSSGQVTYDDSDLEDLFDRIQGTTTGVSLNAAMMREMFAGTRVLEQMARTGSRYTEYLRGFFGTSPRDDTLQRVQYLGGYKQPIITSEVIQTGGAENTSSEQLPVGTLRGHGISNGQGRISFVAKEYGMIFGVMCIRPEQIYSQGNDKEYTYISRLDFFNPAFQHLSEQEIRKGEIFFDHDTNADGSYKNDDVFGFQPYAEELRRGRHQLVADMRSSESLAYWNQGIGFSTRPSLNQALISTKSHLASFNKPFTYSDVSARPVLFQYAANCEIFRPMVKDGIPGLLDHA